MEIFLREGCTRRVRGFPQKRLHSTIWRNSSTGFASNLQEGVSCRGCPLRILDFLSTRVLNCCTLSKGERIFCGMISWQLPAFPGLLSASKMMMSWISLLRHPEIYFEQHTFAECFGVPAYASLPSSWWMLHMPPPRPVVFWVPIDRKSTRG